MAQILGLQILCVGILLLGAGCEGGSSSSSSAALSDSESYIDECEWIKCPETETEATECPADSSSIDYIDIKEFDDIILNPLEIGNSHDNTRAKRDLQSKCCGMPRCRCNKCPRRPQCKADEVIIELSPGNGQPGSCCTQYRCGKEPQCEEGGALIYWPDKCTKCNSCKLPCIDVCYQSDQSSPSNCLTDDKEIKLDGESWLQGHGCVKCVCSEGNSICQEFSCKPAECKNPIKLPHVCCPVCPEEVASSTAGTTSTAANATTEAAVIESSTEEQSTSTISSSTSDTFEESTETTEQPKVEEAAEKSIEIPEIPEMVSTDADAFELETETTEEELLSSSSAPATSTTLQEEEKEEEQTTDNMEDTTVTAMDNPELDSSSSPFTTSSSTFSTSAFTTERPGVLATSSPAVLTPESTSWHRDTNIKDDEYHLAGARSNDARPSDPTNLTYMSKQFISIICVIAMLAILIFAVVCVVCWQRRKTMYSSVPHSDCNLSENTNTSDLVLCIDHPEDDHKLPQKQQQLKKSVE